MAAYNPFATPPVVANPFAGAGANGSNTQQTNGSLPNPFANPIPNGNPFGAPAMPASNANTRGTTAFGQPKPLWSSSGAAPAFGTPSASPAPSAPSAFGAASTGNSTFGPTSSFGTPSAAPGGFGLAPSFGTPSTPALGTASTPNGLGASPAFGAPSMANSSQGSTPSFGAPAMTPQPGPASAFGMSSATGSKPGTTSGFGMPRKASFNSTPAGFGAASTKLANMATPGGFGTGATIQNPIASMPQDTVHVPTETTRQLSSLAADYAMKLINHLEKEKIRPPKMPQDIGDPHKRAAVETLKEGYKKYRTRAYASLRKADLIDDPDKRRRLEDALDFKGICEDMCPEFEKVFRIAEYDVTSEEKRARPGSTDRWPDPARMVKKFARSAAGQDAPLPMDVRTVSALRRTTDYLIDDLLQEDARLPSMHNYLWDRLRAVRKDFTFHSTKTAAEMKSLVYCFENIARFHATALHLLSRKGVAEDGFDQKQEIEQLGRTVLSLVEAYDLCREKKVKCENEAEFRAYYLLLNAFAPSIVQRIPTWGKEYWFQSPEVQTAICLINAMEDVRSHKGPIKPLHPASLDNSMFTNFFTIVEQSTVSYTMACMAEIHFTNVRQCVLRNLVRGYARHRDAPRHITADVLNQFLRFDTPAEAVEFAEMHDFEFSVENPRYPSTPESEPYLVLNSRNRHVPSPRVQQSYSGEIVERKRGNRSLPFVIHNTVYEPENDGVQEPSSDEESLFVGQGPVSNKPQAPRSVFGKPSGSSIPPSTNGLGRSVDASMSAREAPKPALPSSFGKNTLFSTQSSAETATPNPFASAGTAGPVQEPAPSVLGADSAISSPFSGLQGSTGTPQAKTGTGPSVFSSTTTVAGPQTPNGGSPFGSLATSKPSSGGLLFGKTGSTTETASSTASGAAPDSQTSIGQPSTISSPFKTSTETSTGQKNTATTAESVLPAVSQLPGLQQGPPNPFFSSPTPGQTTREQQKEVTFAPAPVTAETRFVPSPPTALPKSILKRTAEAGPAEAGPVSTSSAPPSSDNLSLPNVSQTGAPRTEDTPALPVAPPQAPVPPPKKRDPMGDFAKWFTMGDGGVMEQFTDVAVGNILADAFRDFQEEEEGRKRREEDEQSWREAREFQVYNLSVKFFYRWRKTAQDRRRKAILEEGKRKQREFWARRSQQQRIEAQQPSPQHQKPSPLSFGKAAKEANLLANMARQSGRARADAERRSSQISLASSVSSNQSIEDALLATGVFSGMANERDVAREVVHDGDSVDGSVDGSVNSSLSFLRRRYSRSLDASSLERRPKRSKTEALRQSLGADNGRSSRRGPLNFSTSSSLSASKSMKRTVSATDMEPPPKRITAFKSLHFEMRARGFVQTADGGWRHEADPYRVSVGASRSSSPHSSAASQLKRKRESDVNLNINGTMSPPKSVTKSMTPSVTSAPQGEHTLESIEQNSRALRAQIEELHAIMREIGEPVTEATPEH